MSPYITPERWEEISPETAAYLRDDALFIDTVRSMLDCETPEQLNELMQASRFVLSRMHDFRITREYLLDQINDTFRLIHDPNQYYADAQLVLDDVITDFALNPLPKNISGVA